MIDRQEHCDRAISLSSFCFSHPASFPHSPTMKNDGSPRRKHAYTYSLVSSASSLLEYPGSDPGAACASQAQSFLRWPEAIA